MAKNPRPHKPGPPEPDEALDLLRALARSQGSRPLPRPPRLPHDGGEEKLDALRALAEKLDLQLRAPHDRASDPGPFGNPLAAPTDTPFGMPAAPRRAAAHDSGQNRDSDQNRDGDHDRDSTYDDAPPRPRAGAARSLVPRFGLQRTIFVALSVAVLVAAAVGGVMRHRGGFAFRPGSAPGTAPRTAPVQIVPPSQIVPPTDQASPPPVLPPVSGPPDIATITKSMSECDAAAAKEPEALYFLILPLTAANPADQSWRTVALQTVGSDILLLSAKDALDGLRDHRLNLRTGRYTFSVLDTGTGATYSWTSATSMTRLSKPNVASVKSLRLGFDFSETQAGLQLSAEFKRDVGACYWVSVLVRQ